MVNVLECPVCSSKIFEPVFICKDHSISQEEFQIIRCCNCNFLITSPRPDHDKLNQYYNSENYISHSDTADGFINRIYHIVRKITLKNKLKLIQQYFKKPLLLDIGSGAGYFLNYCAQNGFLVKGIEPDTNSRNRSINQFSIAVYEENELDHMEAATFDAITLWHVLEHIENPNNRIQQIHRLLKKDGIVIIAVPNCSSFDSQYYKTFWAGYDVPRHLWHFTPETLQFLIQKNNFEIIRTMPMYYDAFYVSMLSEKYKNTNFGILRGIFIGLLSNLLAVLNKKDRYSSQIYLLKKKG